MRRLEVLGAVVFGTALLSLAAAPASLAQGAEDERPGAVVGRVLEGGRPLSGVRVLAVGAERSASTGADGEFRMDRIAPGVHRLLVVHPELGADSVRVTVAGGTTTGVTVRYGAGRGAETTLHVGGLPEPETAPTRGPGRGLSRIVGTLLDRRTSEPIASASVRLPSARRQVRTARSGRFVFDSLRAGSYTLRIDHVRYGTQTAEVEVPPRRTVEADVELAPVAIEVDPVRVVADVRSPSLSAADYYQRREWGEKTGYGHFLEGEELQHRGNRISEALGTIPRLEVGSFGGQMSAGSNIPYFPRHRGFSGQCLPAVYLDGQRVVGSGPARDVAANFGPRGINGLVNMSEVAAVEVYPSSSATAGEFQGADSRCGVVVIWTGRGED